MQLVAVQSISEEQSRTKWELVLTKHIRPCLAARFLARYTCIIPAQSITREYTPYPFGSQVFNRVTPNKPLDTRWMGQFLRREVPQAFFTRVFHAEETGIGCPPKTRSKIHCETLKFTLSKRGLRGQLW
jgi:hypothetical protein